MDQPALVRDLLDPAAYAEPVSRVEMVETHISHIFLTDRHAYKVKKPVSFGFVDFSTLERRRHFCEREVMLNRRMSPTVYLGVAEVRLAGGRHSIEGPGTTVEYAVKMRRMPREQALDRLLDEGRVGTEEMRRLAALIADAHRRAETSPEIARRGGEAMGSYVEQNLAQIERYVGLRISREAFDDLRAYSLGFLDARGPLLERRAREGHIRDCHGDLHTDQIYRDDGGFCFLDCIEFNDLLRYIDVAADIAFLAMDLDFHKRPDLSRLFTAAYVEESQDAGVLDVVKYFKVYRALVRAKVTELRLDDAALAPDARQEAMAAARGYHDLARSYVRWHKPSVFLVMGLTGTGKSAIAQELARRWDLAYVSSDITRKQLAGLAPTERREVPFSSDIYSPAFSRRTYEAMFEQAAGLLRSGRSVALDATFSRQGERARAQALAAQLGADLWLIECMLPESVAKQRLDARAREGAGVSDGRWEIYEAQKARWEPVSPGTPRHVLLDTAGAAEETALLLLRRLYASAAALGEM